MDVGLVIEGGIIAAAGVGCTVLAYRAESMTDGQWQRWFQQHGRKIKILGPLMALGGVAMALGLIQ